MKHLLEYSSNYELVNDLLVDAAERGDVDKIQELLKDPDIDPTYKHNRALTSAIVDRRTEVVRILLADGRANSAVNSIIYCSVYGYYDVVELLLKDGRTDPSSNYNHAIKNAAIHRNVEVLKLLLKDDRVDPSSIDIDLLKSRNTTSRVADIIKLYNEIGFEDFKTLSSKDIDDITKMNL